MICFKTLILRHLALLHSSLQSSPFVFGSCPAISRGSYIQVPHYFNLDNFAQFLSIYVEVVLFVCRLIEEDEDEEPESDMMATTYNGLQRLELSKALKLGLHTKEILPKAVLDDL